ncbi:MULTISPECIES: aminoglycoside phosphotransferase family protein [Streptomycetaceae]|uniref:Phosphotransferase n=1 Tax=Streptantibioticus cattleyicolor (strain ATCC 35852 / DSM 46488 / JCM 4925 / NBRC 14057 / NRRL 8057) TaxID=1003195 RepID=F8JTS9_STREN|nr:MULTISPECIES: aminoglycoside phosphotransferase family protein [Streptomycetaceae]AEW96849.1 phosphotransferase [Streptantibioticus cattleyicolor NRRL 8057 = DSM 46488]MYS61329.1 phosphotransferase [Streptomyces sp. SID5468]CCB77179.1 Streptomycin 6-kinase [Streptantibioticus cattleyicolor NRRL 8057 = DSM 46488]
MAPAPHVPLDPPDRLVRTVTAWEGEAGRAWLAGLPGLVAGCLERWELTPERVQYPGGNVSMVVLVRRADTTAATLKIGMVTAETAQEPAALAHWNGTGAVRLLEHAPEAGALLLERLHPDISLRSLPDAKAMLEAAGVLRRLWVPPAEAHPFTAVADHTARLAALLRERRGRPWAESGRPLIDEALEAYERLAGSPVPGGPVLLHGDFHQGNVLAADRLPWLAIDPKPLVGDPGYDLAWLLLDRREDLVASPGGRAAARRRLARLSDALETDPGRLRDWTVFRAVEAGVWCWSVGDRTGGELLLEFASWLAE